MYIGIDLLSNIFRCNTITHSVIYAFGDKSFILKTYNSPKIYFASDDYIFTTGHFYLNNKHVTTFKDITFDKLRVIYQKVINNLIFL